MADVKRTAVNPWTWGLEYGMNQGEIILEMLSIGSQHIG